MLKPFLRGTNKLSYEEYMASKLAAWDAAAWSEWETAALAKLLIDSYRHPEQREDEIFFTNLFQEKDWSEIGWKSKRAGERAYTKQGESIVEARPVFIEKREIEDAIQRIKKEATL